MPVSKNPPSGAALIAQEFKILRLSKAFAVRAIPCLEPLGRDPEQVNVTGAATAWGTFWVPPVLASSRP
jgi:acetyl-CoA acetyltransferase